MEKHHQASGSTSSSVVQTRKQKELLRKVIENPDDMEAYKKYSDFVNSVVKRRRIEFLKKDPEEAKRRGFSLADVESSSSSDDESAPASPLAQT